MKILLTGAGGFIGFHLAKKLLEEKIDVYAIDNLNNYYDVKIKKQRIKILEKISKKNKTIFKFYKFDLSKKKNFEKIKSNKFNIIVNLAAQAGVRYSLINPHSYIDSNILGFLNILEFARKQKNITLPESQYRTILNGVLYQQKDLISDDASIMKTVTKKHPNEREVDDLIFASKVCKHTKSNTIVFAKNKQLIASGVGQTSRVDALKQAVEKANNFKLDLKDSVMASDAFFPFPDCVELAKKSGITSVIQPGGSIKDNLSIEFCDENNMSMVMTGTRHFKH